MQYIFAASGCNERYLQRCISKLPLFSFGCIWVQEGRQGGVIIHPSCTYAFLGYSLSLSLSLSLCLSLPDLEFLLSFFHWWKRKKKEKKTQAGQISLSFLVLWAWPDKTLFVLSVEQRNLNFFFPTSCILSGKLYRFFIVVVIWKFMILFCSVACSQPVLTVARRREGWNRRHLFLSLPHLKKKKDDLIFTFSPPLFWVFLLVRRMYYIWEDSSIEK